MTDSTAVALQRLADSIQIAILERGVQASSLSASWVGVAVGVLGVLFAAMAIATAFVLYRQTKEFHARAELMVASYREIVDKLVEEGRLMATAALESIRAEAADVTKQLAQVGTEHREQRAELEKRKGELEQRRRELEAREAAANAAAHRGYIEWNVHSPLPPPSSRATLADHFEPPRLAFFPLRCPQCGWQQQHPNDGVVGATKHVVCPHCKFVFPLHANSKGDGAR